MSVRVAIRHYDPAAGITVEQALALLADEKAFEQSFDAALGLGDDVSALDVATVTTWLNVLPAPPSPPSIERSEKDDGLPWPVLAAVLAALIGAVLLYLVYVITVFAMRIWLRRATGVVAVDEPAARGRPALRRPPPPAEGKVEVLSQSTTIVVRKPELSSPLGVTLSQKERKGSFLRYQPSSDQPNSVYVSDLRDGCLAQQAGLRRSDVVLQARCAFPHLVVSWPDGTTTPACVCAGERQANSVAQASNRADEGGTRGHAARRA